LQHWVFTLHEHACMQILKRAQEHDHPWLELHLRALPCNRFVHGCRSAT
jgi:hypothetical protein